MATLETQTSPGYFRIALQSGLAAMLCLGLPAGLLFWLILFRAGNDSSLLSQVIKLLQDYGILEIILYFLGVSVWGLLLARISGFRPGWRLAAATIVGAAVGRWSPLTNLDGWAQGHLPGAPVHIVFAMFLSGFIFSVTACIGLAYGLILRSWRAALTLALTTGVSTLLTTLLMILLLDRSGIRVGMGNAAMPKVTAVCTLDSALIGGIVLGVGFSWFVEKSRVQYKLPLTF